MWITEERQMPPHQALGYHVQMTMPDIRLKLTPAVSPIYNVGIGRACA